MNREQRRKEAHNNRRKDQRGKKNKVSKTTRLKKELKELEQELKTKKQENAKNRFIKNLKITGNIALYLTPFVLAGSMAIGINKLIDGTLPFIRDYQTLKKQVFFDYQNEGYTLDTTYDKEAKAQNNTLTIIYPTNLEGYTKLVFDYAITDLKNDEAASLQQAILNKNYTYIQENIKVASMVYEQPNQEEQENLPQINTHLEYETKDKIKFYETKENNLIDSGMFFFFTSMLYLLSRTIFKLNFKTMKENIYFAKREARESKIDTNDLEEQIKVKKQKIKQLGGSSNGK